MALIWYNKCVKLRLLKGLSDDKGSVRVPRQHLPLADMVSKRGLSDLFEIDSAATSREEIGNVVHSGTLRKLRQVGVPVHAHRARQITVEDYRNFDYIIAMERYNLTNLRRVIGEDVDGKVHLILSFAGVDRDIADPWYTGNFDVTYDDIKTGCAALLDFLLDKGL